MKRFTAAILFLALLSGSTRYHPHLYKTDILYAKTIEPNQSADASSESKKTQKKDVSEMPSLSISAPSVLLMEAETGTILYQKNEHDTRPPASVTKIMTLNLIFDAIDKKQIALTDEVTVSESAAAMGGSQVFLEAGEIQTVETLIKCISVASANDACVAYMNSRHYLLYGF